MVYYCNQYTSIPIYQYTNIPTRPFPHTTQESKCVFNSQLKNLPPGNKTPAQREAWAAWFSSYGINADAQVVVYDDGNMTDAARVWFLLQYQGIRRASVLNGGFIEIKPLLDGGGVPSSCGALPSPAQTRPSPVYVPARSSCPVGLSDKSTVRAAIDQRDAVILDVRTEAEYAGVDNHPNPRHGRIPNAMSVPHTRLMRPSEAALATRPAGSGKLKGRLKSSAELRRLFEDSGITPDRRVVVHCQSGGRAALAAMALLRAGYGDVSNYYASFAEWSADPDLPILGPPPTATQSVK